MHNADLQLQLILHPDLPYKTLFWTCIGLLSLLGIYKIKEQQGFIRALALC